MNPIDRILKEKLEGLDVPFDPDAWQLMEQKLEEDGMSQGQPAADSKNVDEALFEKLHGYEARYRPGHWQRMEAMLEEALIWPRRVLRYKLAELSIMLLLFLLLWQYAPITPFGGPQALEKSPQQSAPAWEAPSLNQANTALPSASAAGHSGKSPEADAASAPLPAPPAGGSEARSVLSPSDAGDSAGNRPQAAAKPARPAFMPLQPAGRPSALLEEPRRGIPADAFLPLAAAPLAELERLEPLIAGLVYGGYPDVGQATAIKNRNRNTLRVGMFGSAEYNHITVPSSQEKKLEKEIERYAMGYGGGLSVGTELGRFEIETGAIYAARQYPVGLIYLNGNIRDGLEGQRLQASELNILNVPLHVRYNILHRRSWRAYVLAGASLQVAFQRNYYVTNEPQFSYRPPSQVPPAPIPGDEPAIDRIKKSGLGWFEGGTFEENAYLTGNIGFGMERYINSRWSLFAQPTYQHSLQYFRVGLGPNADRINSLSVFLGAKVRLK